MKKILLASFVLFATSFTSFAQTGLEGVIVERYYVSNANDTNANSLGGVLPIGSVTWRVYLDMMPDYVFQSAYGDANHELRIETTTLFFNNEDRGAVHPSFNCNYCDDNTVMLDSWLTAGGACSGKFGILKSEDDGVGTVVNNDNVLTNNDSTMGVLLTQQDGLLLTATTPEQAGNVGIGTEIMVFDSQNDGSNGPLFSTHNGAWYSVNGSAGPIPATNKVLIAQITTDGVLCFSLNVQLRNQTTLAVEQFVADSITTGSEIYFPTLNFCSTNFLSVNEVQNNPSFSIYPNPVSEETNVVVNVPEGRQKVTFNLSDILGQVVKLVDLGTLSGESVHKLNLSDVSPGIYFLQLNINGQEITRKIVKN